MDTNRLTDQNGWDEADKWTSGSPWLMAHVGADVPAKSFEMTAVDAIFVRMGAKAGGTPHCSSCTRPTLNRQTESARYRVENERSCVC
jgi:hypothetical protein